MLSAGPLTDEEDPKQSAVVEGFLNLQHATGTLHEFSAPLPNPEQAMRQTASDFAEYAQESGAVTHKAAGVMSPASEEAIFASLFPQLSPSHDEDPGSQNAVAKTWQEVYGHAVPVAPWYPLAFPPPVEVFPFPQQAPCFLQPSTVPQQAFGPFASQQEQQKAGPPAHSVAGASLPDSPYQGLTSQRGAALAVEAGESIRAGPVLKRVAALPSMGEVEVPAKLSKLQEVPFQPQPQPENHFLEWEREKPLAGASQGFHEIVPHVPLHVEQPQEPSPEGSSEGLFWKAVEAIPSDWSPEPFDVATLPAHLPQRSEQEEEDEASYQKLWGTDAGGPGFQPTLIECLSAPKPYTSQEVRNAAPAFLEVPLPGPSVSASTERLTAASSPIEHSESFFQSLFPGFSQGPAPQMPPDTHLFYRLPILQPGVITGRFSARRALFSYKRMTSHGFAQLATARFLLSKLYITTQEAEVLITDSEMLVGRIMHELEMPFRRQRPSKAVEKLGRIFLYLDTVVSIIHIIGPPMEPQAWWPQVASCIFPETVYTTAYPTRMPLPIPPAALATRLSSALQILKTGARLGCEETVRLKRELLCNPLGIKDFRHKKWNAWRDDDARSGTPTVQ